MWRGGVYVISLRAKFMPLSFMPMSNHKAEGVQLTPIPILTASSFLAPLLWS